jgi:hypothetical protein
MGIKGAVSFFVSAFLKGYRAATGNGSVDDAIGVFSKAAVSLRAIADRETDRAAELRVEAIRLSAEADAAAVEAARAVRIAGSIEKNYF